MTSSNLTSVVTPSAVFFVVDPLDDERARTLAEALSSSAPVSALVNLLSAAGLDHLPDFACAVREGDDVRVLLRGAVTATVASVGGERKTISGEGVSTWIELVTVDATTVELSADGQPSSLVMAITPVGVPAEAPVVADVVQAAPEPEAAPIAPAPAGDADFDFEHLLHDTHFVSIEDAAVREVDDVPAPLIETPSFVEPLLPPPAPERPPRTEPLRADPLPSSGLIDSVPGLGRSEPTAPVGAVPASQPDAHSNDDLEGYTITLADLRRQGRRSGPLVQAVHCANGHVNPPVTESCRVCSAAIVDRTVAMVQRPSLGVLRFNDGMVMELSGSLLLGRNPSIEPGSPLEHLAPSLVALPDNERALSRNHVAIELRDWDVIVTDQNSTNATQVDIPGRPRERLAPGQPLTIVPGTTVVLGDVVSFLYLWPR